MIFQRFPAHAGAVARAIVTAIVLTGCQTYKPAPLDLAAHVKGWRKNNASDQEVASFARTIAASQPARFDKFDPIDGISYTEGEVISLVFNPDLRIARLNAGIEKATAENAGRWKDPNYNLTLLSIRENVSDPWFLSTGLSLTIPISGRVTAEKKRAVTALNTAFLRIAEAEWTVIRNLRNSWLAWSALRLKREQTDKIIRDLDLIISSISQIADAGELASTEANLFLLEREDRRAELDGIRASIAEELLRIRAQLGLHPEAEIELAPALFFSPDLSRNIDIEITNPSLSRLRGEHEVAERTLVREIRKQYPDLTIGPQTESDEGQSRIGFMGMIPVPVLNSNRKGIAEARASREIAEAAFETEYQRIVVQLARLRARLSGIQSRRNRFDEVLVPLADQQVKDAFRLLELGEGNSLVLLQSIVRAYEAKLALIDLELERTQVANEIRFLLGPNGAARNRQPQEVTL